MNLQELRILIIITLTKIIEAEIKIQSTVNNIQLKMCSLRINFELEFILIHRND